MKRFVQKLLFTLIFLLLTDTAVLAVKVSTRVYLRDSNTPLELANPDVPWVYKDIMAGTQLKIIVNSNEDGDFAGGLFIPRQELDSGFGDLYCIGEDCLDSILPAAGAGALVIRSDDIEVGGFILLTDIDAVSDDWFIIDYDALAIGLCHVGLYDDNWIFGVPYYEMTFNQVPTRDYNGDYIVNFEDFSIFAAYWSIINCSDPDNCGKADFNADQAINIDDLAMFVEFWLGKTR